VMPLHCTSLGLGGLRSRATGERFPTPPRNGGSGTFSPQWSRAHHNVADEPSRLAPRRRRGGARGPLAGARGHGHDIWRGGGGGGGGACAPWSSWAYLWPGGGSVSLSAFSRCAQWRPHRTGLQPTGRGITESR
jgi:hypothetical protein